MGLVIIYKLRILQSNGDAVRINRLSVLSLVVLLQLRALQGKPLLFRLWHFPRGTASAFWSGLGHRLSYNLAEMVVLVGLRAFSE